MKLLLVSMPSIHVIRWIENLKDTSIELFWFDILNKGKLDVDVQINQITGWKKRKIPYIKGEYWLSYKFPKIYKSIQPFLEVTKEEAFNEIIKQIQPDIVHSFEMQSCSYPILKVMNNNQKIKWIYSCWGSDLYYYTNFNFHKKKIQAILARTNYLITDCYRDYEIAKENYFSGVFLGVIPGGTGFKLEELKVFKKPLNERNIILVKGYQHKFGRALQVIKALQILESEIKEYQVVIFGAHSSVINFVKDNKLPFIIYDRHGLNHNELLQLMGKSLIYIGNSISDGMPNTLLEAIVMGAFPIQSNPGGVTSEIIKNKINGLLIDNPESVEEIKKMLLLALNNSEMFINSQVINDKLAKDKYDYNSNKIKIINIYYQVTN